MTKFRGPFLPPLCSSRVKTYGLNITANSEREIENKFYPSSNRRKSIRFHNIVEKLLSKEKELKIIKL